MGDNHADSARQIIICGSHASPYLSAQQHCTYNTTYMEINIIHYHLFVGGVTTVIRNTLASLRIRYPRLSINILCGSHTNTDQLSRQISDAGFVTEVSDARRNARVHSPLHSVCITVDKDLFYHNDTRAAHHKRQRRIFNTLKTASRERNTRTIWWIHNYH